MDRHTLLITSSDKKGLVFNVAKILYEHNLNIIENSEFVDNETSRFFMRTLFDGEVNTDLILQDIKNSTPLDMRADMVEQRKKRVVVMATKESHALGDILIKNYADELNIEILAVVANYDDLRALVERFDIPFFHIPSLNLQREEHESKILETLEQFSFDFLVLAKYMRILTPSFVENYENRIINIHHSFLPAFIGANPYKQAYNRGVKIIGATAHFVNNDLDEGPIIAQDVIRVDHTYSWRDMQKAGRDVEKVVLSRALNLVAEDRVFIYGNKTVIL